MKCPFCQASDSRVIDTRQVGSGIRRRRVCEACSGRFTTYEQIASGHPLVVKSDGRREEFDRLKLLAGIRKACTKRPIPSEAIENMVTGIEDQLVNSGRMEVKSRDIGQMAMEKLREVDKVAYIRFASVYLPLGDLDSIRKELEGLQQPH